MDFAMALAGERFLLAEGAVIERLRRDRSVALDPNVLHAGFVDHAAGRAALARVYGGYLDIGRRYDLPMIVLTPTWRASPARVAKAGLGTVDDVNADCARFMRELVRGYGSYARRVFLGGLIGCSGDAYRPEEALSVDRASAFHRRQACALAGAGVDFVMGSTLPAFSEAKGMAVAIGDTGLPCVLSFVVRPTGTLLDGTPLADAIVAIDTDVSPKPLCYMVNCVHPTVFEQALDHELGRSRAAAAHVIGLQANTSPRPPEELEGLSHLESEPPDVFADAMVRVYRRLGVKVLGGCCGTDDRHIESLARQMSGLLSSEVE